MSEFPKNIDQEFPVYIQYPIDEAVDGVPGKPVQNNEGLAEAMAYAEAPYRDALIQVAHLDLDDVNASILLGAKRSSNEAENQYYEEFGVTKRVAKNMRIDYFATQTFRQTPLPEVVTGAYEHSLTQLNNLRQARQSLARLDEEDPDTHVTTVNRSVTMRQMIEANELKLGEVVPDSILVNNYSKKTNRVLKDLFETARVRRAMSYELPGEARYPVATDAVRETQLSVVGEVSQLAVALETMRQSGALSDKGAYIAFGRFDLARYSFSQFKEIAEYIEEDGSNITELSANFDTPYAEYLLLIEEYRTAQHEKAALQQEEVRQRQLAKAQADLARVLSEIEALSR